MLRFMTTIYGILTTIALFLGLIVAVIFIAAIIIGQEGWALLAADIMTWGIALAAIAMLAGMIFIYGTGSHDLKMEKPSQPDTTTGSDE